MEPEEIKIIGNVIKQSSGFGLEAEVVAFALEYMKQNPTLSIVEAILYGYEEWIK
jgi:hypothetical protein